MKILSKINSPADLKSLESSERELLIEEIRSSIAETVSKNGGHLSSNLGVVELTLALHASFDFLNDRLLWDVGHQSYTHKLITGRFNNFSTIRTKDGLSGFPNRFENPYDVFTTGHAGTAIGSAVGIACGDRVLNKKRHVVALVGDASMISGMSLEAINHAGDVKANVLVILNDNKLAISHTVGAFHKYLDKVRTLGLYKDLKKEIHHVLGKIPKIGSQMEKTLDLVKDTIKRSVIPGRIFDDFGFEYFGPVDGNDYGAIIESIEQVKKIEGPVLLHVMTNKGKGFEYTEKDPIKYYSLKNFNTADGMVFPNHNKKKELPSYSQVFSDKVVEVGKENFNVVAITAAMPDGTGLRRFKEKFPERFFDVGIAEEHATAITSGLCESGVKPIVAMYSTFLQRGYDQIFHEVALQEVAPVFCLDRAGVVGEDGATHNGVFDIAFLRHLPSNILMAPKDGAELSQMIELSIGLNRACFIRYPKESIPEEHHEKNSLEVGKAEILREGENVVLFAYGAMVCRALKASDMLSEEGIDVTVVNARFAKPIDHKMLENLSNDHSILMTLEDHTLVGGFGSAVLESLTQKEIFFSKVKPLGIPDQFLEHGSRDQILEELNLHPRGIADSVKKVLSHQPSTFTPHQSEVSTLSL